MEDAKGAAAEVADDTGYEQTDMDAAWMEFEFDTSQTEDVAMEYKSRSRYDWEGEGAAAGWSGESKSINFICVAVSYLITHLL